MNTLKSKSLRSVVDEVREMVDRSPTGEPPSSLPLSCGHTHTYTHTRHGADVLNEFCEKLRLCVKEVESTVGSPGPRLASAVQALVDTTTAYTQGEWLCITSHLTHTPSSSSSSLQRSCCSSLYPWPPMTVSVC